MDNILVIGGMGAGKSSVTRALASEGLAVVDLDEVGHEVLTWDVVKSDLLQAFGSGVFEGQSVRGSVDRGMLAQAAFASTASTEALNCITQPRIMQALRCKLDAFQACGSEAVVIESSSFTGQSQLVALASVIVLVVAPLEQRIARAVAAGWAQEDVRARIEQQISDETRARFATVTLVNDSTPEHLAEQAICWWRSYRENSMDKHDPAKGDFAALGAAPLTSADNASASEEREAAL